MTLVEILESAAVNSLGLAAVAWITNRLTTANQRALAEEAASRALASEERGRAAQLAAEKRARKAQAAADERADRRQKEAAALSAAAQKEAAALSIAAQNESDARANRRELESARRAEQRQHLDLLAREQRRALLERLTLQRRTFEEYVGLWQESYRGPVDVDSRNQRIADRQPFRARVMFAFADEAFANEVVASLFHADDVNAGRNEPTEARQADPGRWKAMLQTERVVIAKMLASIRRFEGALGYDPLVLTEQTEKHASGGDGGGTR